MKNIIALFCIAFIVFGFGSCKKNPVEPGDDEENLQPGRRDYTWTIDTLKTYYVHLYSCWGTSPSDVYVVGPGGGDVFWRYLNEKWLPENRVTIYDPIDICGFKDKMWVCSQQGQIWKYADGIYKKELDIWLDTTWPVRFYDIDGSSENEIFASAGKSVKDAKTGLLFKYNGSTWSLYKTFENSGVFNVFKYSSKNNKYYCNSVYPLEAGEYLERIYEFDRENLKMLNEHVMSLEISSTINTIQGYVYFTIGKKIYRYTNDNMELMFEVNDPNFGGQLWGRNKKDILVRMYDGIAHYDGEDYQYLLKVSSDVSLAGQAMVFEKEVFIPAQDYKTGYQLIYHGVLK